MPADSTQTVQDILESAKAEFLQHGFAGASLRRIAQGAGVTTGALYRHFADKDALFAALVEPVYSEFLRRYHETAEQHFRQLEHGGIDSIWDSSASSMEVFTNYIYEHFGTFKLLISASEQTPYERFTHTLVDTDVDLTLKYIRLARKLGHPVRDLQRDELHLVINAQFSCLYELVLHDIPRADAERLLHGVSRFFSGGWKSLMLE